MSAWPRLCSMCCAAPGHTPCAFPDQQSLLMGELLQLLENPRACWGLEQACARLLEELGCSVLHAGGGWHSISPALHRQGEPGAGLSVPNVQ